jgi:hypothetical protein
VATLSVQAPGQGVDEGIRLFEACGYVAAAALLGDVYTSEPDSRETPAHYGAGVAYNNLNDHSRMIDHFETLLAWSPEGPEADRIRRFLRSVR